MGERVAGTACFGAPRDTENILDAPSGVGGTELPGDPSCLAGEALVLRLTGEDCMAGDADPAFPTATACGRIGAAPLDAVTILDPAGAEEAESCGEVPCFNAMGDWGGRLFTGTCADVCGDGEWPAVRWGICVAGVTLAAALAAAAPAAAAASMLVAEAAERAGPDGAGPV